MSLFHSEFVQPFPDIEQSPEILLREVSFIIMHDILFFKLTNLSRDMRGCDRTPNAMERDGRRLKGPQLNLVPAFSWNSVQTQ